MSDQHVAQPSNLPTTRTVTSLTRGSKLAVLLALLLLIWTLFLLLSPIFRTDGNKSAVDCGTLVNPPTTKFVEGLCGTTNDQRLAQTVAVGAAALLVGIGGVMTFGVTRREVEVSAEDHDS